ncbi:MAG: efflux RND transporter periplasmic adaptor subunit [Pseudomonadota bacterium]
MAVAFPNVFRSRWPALCLIAGVGLLAACDSESNQPAAAAQAAPPPSVVVEPIVFQEVATTGQVIGRTEASQRVEYRARVTGFLEEQAFTEGALVNEGDLLFRIDDAEFQAAHDAATADVQGIQATLTQAQAELQRTETLFDGGNIAESTLDERRGDVARAEASLAAAQAALDRAELDLGYTQIQSAVAGRVGESQVDVGNLIGPDSGVLATVVALDPMYVTFSMAERVLLAAQADAIEAGHLTLPTVEIELADGSVYPTLGTIDFIDNEIDVTTGTLRIRAVFDNPDDQLVPGQFVEVVLTTAETENVALVPQSAVQQNQSGYFVLVVDSENRVEARTVTTGARIDGDWVIESGLEEGETIVVEGVQRARPGGLVTPVEQTGG